MIEGGRKRNLDLPRQGGIALHLTGIDRIPKRIGAMRPAVQCASLRR